MIMLFVGVVAWLLTDPTRLRGHSSVANAVNAILVPAADIVLAFGVAKVVLGGAALFTRAAGVFGCLSAVLQVVNVGTTETLVAHGHASWKLAICLLTDLVALTCLRAQHLRALQGPRPLTCDRRGLRHSRLPYIALAASYGLLVWVLGRHRLGTDEWVVLLGTIAGSGMVAMRQLAAFADNDDLLAERDALAERLRHLAYHDGLTCLANRSLFMERLAAALADDAASKGGASGGGASGGGASGGGASGGGASRPTVVIIDLDGFKPVNDRFGHQAGDALLVAVAERLRRSVRPADTVARLGGDEFAILVHAARPIEISSLVRRVAAAIGEPVDIAQNPVSARISVRASIGTATAADSDDVTTLLHRADLEMYADKQLAKLAPSRCRLA